MTVLLLCILIFNSNFYKVLLHHVQKVLWAVFPHCSSLSLKCLMLTSPPDHIKRLYGVPSHTKSFCVNPLWDGRTLTKSPCKPISQRVSSSLSRAWLLWEIFFFPKSDVGRISTSEVSLGNIRRLKACEVLRFSFAYFINSVSAPQTHTTEVPSTTRHCSICAEVGRVHKWRQVRNWLPR